MLLTPTVLGYCRWINDDDDSDYEMVFLENSGSDCWNDVDGFCLWTSAFDDSGEEIRPREDSTAMRLLVSFSFSSRLFPM